MKTLVLVMMTLILSSGAFASTANQETQTPFLTELQMQKGDFYLMQNKKVWFVKSGEKTELVENATLENGTVIKTDGTVQPKDGEAFILEENHYIDLEGNVGVLPQPDEK